MAKQKETEWFAEQRRKNGGKIPAHLASATMFTRFGVLDDRNWITLTRPKRRREWEKRNS